METTSSSSNAKVNPPEKFSFNPDDWPGWIRRYERYRRVSGLKNSPEEEQVDHLIYSLGENTAEDIFDTFQFTTEGDDKLYEKVKDKFEGHFIAKRNIVYERAMFNSRIQREDEDVLSFITDLYVLSKHCAYDKLQEELIRDRIVVGLRDRDIAEELQMDASLTLEKAKNRAILAEQVKKQQPLLRGPDRAPALEVNAVKKPADNKTERKKRYSPRGRKNDKSQCRRCGEEPFHPRDKCPASKERCGRCMLVGHATRMCRTRNVNCVQGRASNTSSSEDEYYVRMVGASLTNKASYKPGWNVTVIVNGVPIICKVDTGADCSVMNWTDFKKIPSATISDSYVNLYGPGQKRLDIAGKLTAELQWKGLATTANFYVGSQNTTYENLLGLPEIKALNLIEWPPTKNMPASISAVKLENSKYQNVYLQYPKVFEGIGQVKEPYHIVLTEGAKPHAITVPRRVPIPLREAVRTELGRLEDQGIIEKIDEPTDWCAGMVPVAKSNNKVRICVDLKKLNENIKRERFMMPKVEEALALIGEGAKVFSKLDQNSGYWQIPLTATSAKLTCFLTPFGRYFFRKLPMGLSSASEHYERRMRETLNGIEGVVSLQDDTLIFGKCTEEHDLRLHKVLNRLQKAGITLNKEKCVFGVRSTKFLGHIVSDKGVSVDPEKVEAVVEFPTPKNVTDIRSFLGLVAQHSKFIPDYAEQSKPLRELLIKSNEWCWDNRQRESFENLKKIVCKSPVLALYDPNLETRVTSDACRYGIGGLLEQKQSNNTWRPVSYCSRSLSPTETRYAILEKEALAATWVSERFSDYLRGIRYTLVVDHKPLISLLGGKDLNELTMRIQRFRMRLMAFNYVIEYQPGKTLAVADALSRYPVGIPKEKDLRFEKTLEASVSCITLKINCSDANIELIRKAQEEDPTSQELRKNIQDGWALEAKNNPLTVNLYRYKDNLAFLDSLILYEDRLYIPHGLRRSMLAKLHEGHLGIEKCRRRARGSMWWPNMNKEIAEFIAECDTCLQNLTNPKEPMLSSKLPTGPWKQLGADIGYHKEKRYLILEDYYSRYPEIVDLPNITAAATIQACKSVFARHGIPLIMRVDAGSQFTSAEFKKFTEKWCIRLEICSPKHSRANGLAESGEKTVKKIFDKSTDLYLGLLAYRASPLESGMSPAELLMGRRIRTTIPQLNLDMPGKFQDFVTQVLRPAAHPRSYIVHTQQGDVRRNRANLVPRRRSTMLCGIEEKSDPQEFETTTTSVQPTTPQGNSNRRRQSDPHRRSAEKINEGRDQTRISTQESPKSSIPKEEKKTVTSRGRLIKKPKRLTYD